jgi:hypothetical protein
LQGYLDIDLLLNCNKIKALNVTKGDICEVVKHSNLVELDQSGEKYVRRKDNKPLPELKLLSKKRRADADIDLCDNDNEKEEELQLDPIILEIHSDQEIEFKWKDLQEEFRRLNPNLNVVYLRFNKQDGHIGLFKKSDEDLKFTEEFEFNGVKFTVKRCEGDNIIDFWKIHGTHFEICIGRKKQNDKKGRGKRGVDPNLLKKPVTLGGETYILY